MVVSEAEVCAERMALEGGRVLVAWQGHRALLEAGWEQLQIPYAPARKYPQQNHWCIPSNDRQRHQHIDPAPVRRAVKQVVRTTMIYNHVLNRGPLGVSLPADFL